MNLKEERELRYSIRSFIRYVKQKRLTEEKELRTIIRSMLDRETKILSVAQQINRY